MAENPATRMLTVLDWWLHDHFDGGRNPGIATRIVSLQDEIRAQIKESARPDCSIVICTHCTTPNGCRAINRCAMEESRGNK